MMKKAIILGIICLVLDSIHIKASDNEITVMTYNIRAGSLTTIDSLAEMINSRHPDFVALQEVDVMTNRANAKNMNGKNIVSALAAKTNMFGYFCRTLNFVGGYYGIAILSRHPSTKMESFPLPNPLLTEPRALLLGRFEIDGKKEIAFACTHLDVKSADTRTMQVDYINNIIQNDSILTIIGGDFNATPGEPCISRMHQSAIDISGTSPTFPASAPDRKIDYLFVYPACESAKISCSSQTLPSQTLPDQLSDHRAIVSTVRITP